jgi:hypothetical protein
MRSRGIKPGFFKNEDLAELEFGTRLLFIGLWTMADREGRLEDRIRKIKIELFPADNVDIDAMLVQLHGAGFVHRYVIDNKGYIQIINFKKHQSPHMKEPPSTIPAPDMHHTSQVQNALTAVLLTASSLTVDSCSKPTTATRTENIFIDCFAQNEKRIKELYPHADYEAERETCIAHYRTSNPPLDCYPVVLKWFQRVPKNKSPAPASRESERDRILRENAASCRQFAEGNA